MDPTTVRSKEKEKEPVCVIIPAFRPEPDLPERIRAVIRAIPCQMLLVDDGSGPQYRMAFDRAEDLPGCQVLRHRKNRGKGRALKTAFAFLQKQILEVEEPDGSLPRKRTRILCMDCDGQHLVADGVNLLNAAEKYPGSLILGARDFTGRQTPLRSRLGNRIISRIFYHAAGIWLPDTQTGLRAFDNSLLPLMLRTPGEGYAYEMEVLIACVREGVPVRSRNISTIYINANAGSHFHPVRDSLQVLAVCARRSRRCRKCSGRSRKRNEEKKR